MKQFNRMFWKVAYAALLVLAACSNDNGKQEDIDSAGDIDNDTDSDTDTDGDTDTDIDTEGETDSSNPDGGQLPCDDYPPGPYGWDIENTIPAAKFPGIYGSGGEESELDMCAVYKNRANVKSLIFALGAKG
ncbi:MAG: hypothetical protein GY847_20555 [Proteobacteria bacterium]|nr:hypothetical protein [Pseudomonadota bacterium]